MEFILPTVEHSVPSTWSCSSRVIPEVKLPGMEMSTVGFKYHLG